MSRIFTCMFSVSNCTSNNIHLKFQSPQTQSESSPTSSWWLECLWECTEWQKIVRWPSQILAASEHNKGQNPRKALNIHAVTPKFPMETESKPTEVKQLFPLTLKKLEIQCKSKLKHIILFHKKNTRLFSSTYFLFSCIWILLSRPQFSAPMYTYEPNS